MGSVEVEEAVMVQRWKDATDGTKFLFNFSIDSHPHALCVGLLAFMHTEASQHKYPGRCRDTVQVCMCAVRGKTSLHNGGFCVYDVPTAIGNSFM